MFYRFSKEMGFVMPYHGICIGFVSGKGGAGKTALLTGIGAALAQLGKRTLCMDCNMNFRSLDLALGLTEQSLMDFTDVAAGRCTLDDAVTEHPSQPGLFLLNAPARDESFAETQVQALAAGIRERFDYCLLDAPPGLGDGFRLVTQAADRVFVVAELNPLSRRAAQRVALELESFPPDAARLIVNRVSVRRFPFRKPELTVDDIMDSAGLPLMGLVPEDEAVSLALSRGIPVTLLSPESAAARACRNIARRVTGEAVKLPRLYR